MERWEYAMLSFTRGRENNQAGWRIGEQGQPERWVTHVVFRDWLNRYGLDGWELVTFTPDRYHFSGEAVAYLAVFKHRIAP
jgi:Domain of unknown function (DUF4177)